MRSVVQQRTTIRKIAVLTGWALLLGTWLATIAAFAGRWHWHPDLFAHFRPQYLVSFGVLACAFLCTKQWKSAVIALLGFLLNSAVLEPHLRASAARSVDRNGPLTRCISLNLLQGNSDYAAVEQFLRGSDADVIVLQEVTPKWETILKRLTDLYPAQLIRATTDSKGAALLTRLNAKRLYYDPFGGDASIGAVVGELETGTTPITVFGVHSHKPTSAGGADGQQRYFKWLAKRSAEPSTPVILMGDFNSTPWSEGFRAFSSMSPLVNSGQGTIFSATWNRGWPNQLMIDHAFVSSHWRLVKRQVGTSVGSDHRPLIIDLALGQ